MCVCAHVATFVDVCMCPLALILTVSLISSICYIIATGYIVLKLSLPGSVTLMNVAACDLPIFPEERELASTLVESSNITTLMKDYKIAT